MKRLFLTSSISISAVAVAKAIHKPGARLLFITTAAEPLTDQTWLLKDRQALVDAGFEVTDFTITNQTVGQIEKTLSDHDILFVSGGNNLYLLWQVQQTKSAALLKQAIDQGKIYIGNSAGAQLVSPSLYAAYTKDNAKQAPDLSDYTGLGVVDFIVFPHWGNELFEKVYFGFRLKHAYKSAEDKIILLTDRQFVQVEDDMYKVLSV